VPPDNVADLLESGLYGLMTPKRFGGSELGSETMVDVTIELASACASTGWVYMLWTAHMWMLAMFPPETQEEIWANPNTLASSVVNTSGEIEPVEGGYRWTGKGFFSSGVDHCNWLTAATQVKREGHEPERRWFLLAREDFEIVDDWHTVGLRGTGSKTIVFNNIFIPDRRSISNRDVDEGRAPGRAIHSHPMYGAISSANFTAAMAAPAVGAARGFLELFEERLRGKVAKSIDDQVAANMIRYAGAAAQIDALQTVMKDDARRLRCVPATEVPQSERSRCRRNHAFAAQTSRKTVNSLYEECGVNGAAAHHGLTWDGIAAAWAKGALGIDPTPGTTLAG
jgi:alkylation response protein AidB-like acyl-CoA dehydrogenase